MIPRTLSAALAAALPLALAAPAVGQETIIYDSAVIYEPAPRAGLGSPASAPTGETFVRSGKVGVLISPDGSKVWGYAAKAGGLTPLPVDVPEAERGKVRPVVSQGAAMVVVDGVAYAYGGESGAWGSQEIGDRKNAVPIVGGTVAAIRVAGGVYAFSGVTGTGGLHPLADDEETSGPSVGDSYATVASDRGFGIFSAEAGKWGSVTYPEPPENAEASGAGTNETDTPEPDAGAEAEEAGDDPLMKKAAPEVQSDDVSTAPAAEPAAEAVPAPPEN